MCVLVGLTTVDKLEVFYIDNNKTAGNAAYVGTRNDRIAASLVHLRTPTCQSPDICYPSRTLRSQDTSLLAVPRTKTVFGPRAFRVAAPTVFKFVL